MGLVVWVVLTGMASRASAQPFGAPNQLPPSLTPPSATPVPPVGDGFELHRGGTTEASVGLFQDGLGDTSGGQSTTLVGLGIGLGVGGFVTPRLAITARVAGGFVASGSVAALVFIGPSAQWWMTPKVWLGAGVGLAGGLALSDCGSNCGITGIGFDARVGYAFSATARRTFNISIEATPAYYSQNGDSVLGFGLAVLLGYQSW